MGGTPVAECEGYAGHGEVRVCAPLSQREPTRLQSVYRCVPTMPTDTTPYVSSCGSRTSRPRDRSDHRRAPIRPRPPKGGTPFIRSSRSTARRSARSVAGRARRACASTPRRRSTRRRHRRAAGGAPSCPLIGSRADVMLVHFRPTLDGIGDVQRSLARLELFDCCVPSTPSSASPKRASITPARSSRRKPRRAAARWATRRIARRWTRASRPSARARTCSAASSRRCRRRCRTCASTRCRSGATSARTGTRSRSRSAAG